MYPFKGDKGIRTTVNYANYYYLLYTGIIYQIMPLVFFYIDEE